MRYGYPSRGTMAAQFGVGAMLHGPVLLLNGAPLLQATASIWIASYLALGPMSSRVSPSGGGSSRCPARGRRPLRCLSSSWRRCSRWWSASDWPRSAGSVWRSY